MSKLLKAKAEPYRRTCCTHRPLQFRHEISDYVFYLSEDARIREHLNDYEDSFFDEE